MPQYRIRVSVAVVCSESIDVTRLKLASRAKRVKWTQPMLTAVFIRDDNDPVPAAEQAVEDLKRAMPPGARFASDPVWMARVRRTLVGSAVTGHSDLGPDEDDDGLGGVREPRRPAPPSGSAAMALDVPDS
jgi:hypothetical protein